MRKSTHYGLTPHFPKEVFENLPLFFKKGCDYYSHEREKDVFLFSAIVIVSGCLPGLTGRYDKEIVAPNLYGFVLAPAGSGKAPVKHACQLGKKIDTHLRNLPSNGEFGRALYLSGNTSPSALIEHLHSNHGRGIICETEADTIGNLMLQDWGDYSDLLRKAFHHETISISRKQNYEHVTIDKPKLSILLSGTPNQLQGVINSVQNGLFSRFSFYAFAIPAVWKDVTPDESEDVDSFMNELGTELLEIYLRYDSAPVNFTLSYSQWEQLNAKFRPILPLADKHFGEDATGMVKRLGLIAFRTAMILTAIRNGPMITADNIECNSTDFETTMTIIDSLLEHSLTVFKNAAETKTIVVVRDKSTFFNHLPNSFKRYEAVIIGNVLGVCSRDCDTFLSELTKEGALYKPKQGEYIKVSANSAK